MLWSHAMPWLIPMCASTYVRKIIITLQTSGNRISHWQDCMVPDAARQMLEVLADEDEVNLSGFISPTGLRHAPSRHEVGGFAQRALGAGLHTDLRAGAGISYNADGWPFPKMAVIFLKIGAMGQCQMLTRQKPSPVSAHTVISYFVLYGAQPACLIGPCPSPTSNYNAPSRWDCKCYSLDVKGSRPRKL